MYFASACPFQARCEELLTRGQLKSLPEESNNGLIPRLDVEWSTLPVDHICLLVTFHTHRWGMLYNPFGDTTIGSPYRIILTDSDWDPVYEVVTNLPANHSIPDPKAWIDVYDSRIIGRRICRHRDWTPTDENELPRVPLTTLPEGDYLLHLMVTERLETVPPFNEDITERAKSQSRWRSNALDRCAYRSRPVPIQIGPDGQIRRAAIGSTPLNEASPVRVTTTMKEGRLEIDAILIFGKGCRCLDPGLKGDLRVDVSITPPIIFRRAGKSFQFRPEDYRDVPKDAILGIREQYDLPINPGIYDILTTFPSSLWPDEGNNPGNQTGKSHVTIEPTDILNQPDQAP